MHVGLFYAHQLPDTPPHEGFEWDLQVTRWAEEYGFAEAWFSEHFTEGYERWCAPELQIAAAIRETSRMKFGTAANLLPYHNPVALAHRLMALDHMSKGRLMVGFGAGAFPTDAQLFGTELPTQNHEMLLEGHDLIKAIWQNKGEALTIKGKHFSVDIPELIPEVQLGGHWRPYQEGGPRTAIAAFSPRSSTIREGGKRGDIPLSIAITNSFLQGHWEVYSEGATSAGLTPDRRDWRVVRDVIVGETEEKAMELALSTPISRAWNEWIILANSPHLQQMVAPDLEAEKVDQEYLARNVWIVGTPDTVVEKLRAEQESAGGYGTLLVYNYDFHSEPELYRRHLELLGTEVAPALKDSVDGLVNAG
ncbi:LLM class flavin-dependent oxidoreductase [Gordonia sp. SID5947]|uniref:LLM class flavin-dependent oxidoreductase n=1 Tax=Gordonia sp. SID5947 TaxID=2690315 RepID=UPI00136BF2BF|nr:LLM class flavin-dependent oxidoreductase [Gordonia sp. SID5947]MYR07943.1 LLM class flavin-dependent oxidoreductase [Gordonia sp. SID5947]